MSAGAEDQRRRANGWRTVVATTLRSLGIADAEARPAARRSSEETFGTDPDVYTPGLGVHVKASPIPWGRVSVYLNRARQEADERAHGDVPVLVRPAPAEGPEDSYVVLRLADFAQLAQNAAKDRES